MDLVQKSINAIQQTASNLGKRVTSNFGWAGQQAQQNIVGPVQQAAPSFSRGFNDAYVNTYKTIAQPIATNYAKLSNFANRDETGLTKAYITKPISSIQRMLDPKVPLVSQEGLKRWGEATIQSLPTAMTLVNAPSTPASAYLGNAAVGATFNVLANKPSWIVEGLKTLSPGIGIALNAMGNPQRQFDSKESALKLAREGAIAGAIRAPNMYKITQATNPIINKFSSKLGAFLGSDKARQLIAGVASIPEGMLINSANGLPYTTTDLVIDFAMGAGTSQRVGSKIKQVVNEQISNIPKMTPEQKVFQQQGFAKIASDTKPYEVTARNRQGIAKQLETMSKQANSEGNKGLADRLYKLYQDVTFASSTEDVSQKIINNKLKNIIDTFTSSSKITSDVKAQEIKPEEYAGYSRVPTPEEVMAKVKADAQRATDTGIQKTGGVDAVWNNDPTLKGRIDSAFDKGDMATVEKLLPQVPDEYKSNYVRVGKAPTAPKPVDLEMQVQKIAEDVRKERQLYGQEQMVREEMDIRTKEGKAQIKAIKSETDAIRERLRYNEEQFAHTGSRPVSRLEMEKLFDESVAKYKTKPASISRLDELMQTPDDRITGQLYSDDYLAQRKGQLNEAKLVKSQEVAKAREAAAKVEADKVISEEADTFLSDLEAYKNAPPPPKQTFKQVFADFVNTLRSSYTDEAVIRQKLQAFNDVRSDKFIEIQQGDKNNVYGPVREALDAMNKAEKEAGIHYGYQENYLPQMWDNTQDEVKKVFKDRLIKTPGFSLEKVVSDYRYGIENGLKPKYDSLVDLVAARQKLSTRAIASKKFYTFLTENNLIKPQDKAPGDWVMLDPESVKGTRYIDESTGIEQFRNLYAPPTVAKFINNYFKPQDDIIAKSAKFTSSVKNIQSSFGIPGTGINAQGFHEGLRNILSAENPLEATVRTFQYLLYPKAAKNYVAENLTRAPYAVRMGVNLSTNEFNSKIDTSSEAVTKLPTKLGEAWNKWFGTPLFENVIPAFKIQRFYEVQNRMMKSGMDEYSAGKAAAEFVNTAFAGINIDEIGRSKQAQNIARTFLFAPDWMESNVRMGAGIVKSLLDIKNPAGMAYRTTARNMMGAFVLANVINKVTSGHFMWENDPGHTFEIEAGYTEDGQKRHLKWAGTALDFARLPIDVIIGLSQGDFSVPARIVRNRLSTPAQGAFSLLTNTDAFGNPVYGKEKYGQPMDVDKQIVNVSSQVLNAVGMPWFLQEFAKGISGQQGLEQTLLKGFELPFRYSGGAYSNTQKNVMQALGGNISGKEKYDITKDLKGIGLKEGELGYIRQGGKGNLYKLLDAKEKNAKIKEDFEKGDSSTTLDSDGIFRYMNESGNLSKIDYSKFLKIPTSNIEATKQKYEALKLANQILENTSIKDEDKKMLIDKLPVSYKDVIYYNNASMPTEIKELMIQEEIQNLINQGKSDIIPQYLASQRQSVAGKMMLTDILLNKLASDGQISYSLRDAVKNTTVDENGNFVQKVKVSKPKKPKKISIRMPKIKAVKAIKSTKFKAVKMPKFKALKAPKIGK